MKVFHAEQHRLHAPEQIVVRGAVVPNLEQPGRIDAQRGGDVENFELKRLAGTEGTILGEGGWEFLDPIGFLNLNLRNKPLDDVRFRKALAHAIDRGFIVRTIFSGIGRQTNGPFTSRSPFKDTSAEIAYPYDPAKAKALLDEMGLKPNAKGVRAELKLVPLPYGETWQRLAEFIRECLSEIGVGVTIVSTDVPGWYKRITAGDFDLAINFVYLLGDAGADARSLLHGCLHAGDSRCGCRGRRPGLRQDGTSEGLSLIHI